MNILLINNNPVVSRIISLCMRDEVYNLEEVETLSSTNLNRYDILFVNDDSYDLQCKDKLEEMTFSKKVFLLSKEHSMETIEDFDEVINKPFLPSQISSLLEDFVDIDEEQNEELLNTPILNNSEIDKIKAILEEDANESLELELDEFEMRKTEVIKEHLEADGLEIVDEDDMAEILSKKATKKKSKKRKKRENHSFEETLIEAVKDMKVKKIRKLLKGAEITIKINFKESK
ncbi:Highly acidic protein [hydrothermal vent metagenome]|uniref:Highly acidic protein n=1 Tax=hydrothermal vent metagenome TaxID=652676 RepID=A0A1W1EBT2_9ZZZZ